MIKTHKSKSNFDLSIEAVCTDLRYSSHCWKLYDTLIILIWVDWYLLVISFIYT